MHTVDRLTKKVYAMGTSCEITIYDKLDEEVLNSCIERLYDIENKMSVFKNISDVSTINSNAGKGFSLVSPDTAYVIRMAKKYSNLSNGAFSITVKPLINLWKQKMKDNIFPNKEEIFEALKLVNDNDILIRDNRVMLLNQNQEIDLGSIAKGYAADEIKKLLEDYNVKSAIINLGGNVMLVGKKLDNSKWQVGLQNPFKQRGEIFGYIELPEKTVVTSGSYERFYIINGIKFSHIINPINGYPVSNTLASVTVVTDNSIDADAMSTILFVLGLKDGIDFVKTLEEFETIFVATNKMVFCPSTLKENIKILDSTFEVSFY
ncbi:FAD:protein FMN transferase [Caldicellulosiruptoraceae bacterium PP1]